jgi:hypothetical protein
VIGRPRAADTTLMDIAALSTSLQQSKLQSAVSYKLAAKANDIAKEQGASAISLLKSAKQLSDASQRGTLEALSQLTSATEGLDVMG